MKNLKNSFLSLFFLFFSSCTYTTATMLNDTQKYEPTQNVEILFDKPNRPYKVIAILESDGAAGMQQNQLLESIRKKAKEIGADAVIPVQGKNQKTPVQLMYNPWLGGYQTMGGWNKPKLRAVAIKYR